MDYSFHEQLAKSTNNTIILNIFNFLYPYIKKAIIENVRGKKDLEETITSHQKILDLIKKRDFKEALESLESHFKYTKRTYYSLQNRLNL